VCVDDGWVDVPGLDAGERLGGERLVQLDRGDVAPTDAGPFQRDVGRLDGGEAEELRVSRRRSAAGDPGEWRQSQGPLGRGTAEERG
jgi:hypothetical protein